MPQTFYQFFSNWPISESGVRSLVCAVPLLPWHFAKPIIGSFTLRQEDPSPFELHLSQGKLV